MKIDLDYLTPRDENMDLEFESSCERTESIVGHI